MGAPLDANNPYNTSRTQRGFGTLGDPYIASLLCAVAKPASQEFGFHSGATEGLRLLDGTVQS
jgi:hypothetical protein